MKKLSEYKDKEAIVLLGKLIGPVALVMADKEVLAGFKKSKLHAVSAMIEKHADQVFEILAILEGVEPEEYHCNIVTAPAMIIEILQDEVLMDFFTSVLPKEIVEDFGLQSGTTEA